MTYLIAHNCHSHSFARSRANHVNESKHTLSYALKCLALFNVVTHKDGTRSIVPSPILTSVAIFYVLVNMYMRTRALATPI